jgi:hypothetical protein
LKKKQQNLKIRFEQFADFDGQYVTRKTSHIIDINLALLFSGNVKLRTGASINLYVILCRKKNRIHKHLWLIL